MHRLAGVPSSLSRWYALAVAGLFALASLAILAPPLGAQAKPDALAGPSRRAPRPIADAFARDAVTYDDLVEQAKDQPFVPGELVVALSVDGAKRDAERRLRSRDWAPVLGAGVRLIAPLMAVERGPSRSVVLAHLSLPEGMDVFTAMQVLGGLSDVLWASPNFVQTGDPRDFVPNDPSYGAQYHHPLMQNPLAWDVTLGSAAVTIAITDDGMALSHPDLAPNLWTNPGEIAGNGLDDDANGYVDDVRGWDFASQNGDPSPNTPADEHGTHVAGIAAARTHNGAGVAGVAGHCTLMPLQIWNGSGFTSTILNGAFRYAADHGARVVNTSFNFDAWVGNAVVTAALQYLHDAGVLHFLSAGNDSRLNPRRQSFTQSLFVASTDADDLKSASSNYGTGIDVSAPGSGILSTVPQDGYDHSSGTSMATPNAAGAAALLWSAHPSWTSYQVACRLLATADDLDAANPAYAGLLGAGRVNTYAALSDPVLAPLPPPRIDEVTGIPGEGGSVAAGDLLSFGVAFTQVMDRASIDDLGHFELRGAGPNGAFGDGDDVVPALAMPVPYLLGANEVPFTIAGAPLPCGTYRLTVFAGGVTNAFATALDGDANGAAGGDFVRTFDVTSIPHYLDADGDGYGSGPGVTDCPPTPGYVTVSGDCHDGNPEIRPGAAEYCNGSDDDCDGRIDFPPPAYPSTNVPVAVVSSAPSTVTSTLTLAGLTGTLASLSVQGLRLRHTYVSDLRVSLTSPGGTTVVLFDRAGSCSQNHLLASFDDAAVLTAAQFEATCAPSTSGTPPPYAISGTYQPAEPLAAFAGTDPNGTWTLTVEDFEAGDGGALESWSLSFHTSTSFTTYYADLDGDGYGNPAQAIAMSCTPGFGLVLDGTDCNDEAPAMHPGATEECDLVDNDCDGTVDEGACAASTGPPGLPDRFALGQNRPNPAQGKTLIEYAVPTNAWVDLEVYDLGGRRVASLVSRRVEAGRHVAELDPSALGAGIYFYRMSASGTDGSRYSQVRRLMRLR